MNITDYSSNNLLSFSSKLTSRPRPLRLFNRTLNEAGIFDSIIGCPFTIASNAADRPTISSDLYVRTSF